MKNIDEQVRAAVMYGDWFANCNTIVSHDGDRFKVVLHGSVIAEGHSDHHGDFTVDRATFAGWPTNTTRRRLRALGVDTIKLAKKEKAE